MTVENLDLLIVSDLHAHLGDPNLSNSPSFLSVNSLYGDLNPLTKIPELLQDENLSVDWILSPGDLGDKADPSAQKFAWDELNQLKVRVGAQHLIGTAGNHDLDSRRTSPDFDLKGSLQLLHPSFPIDLQCFQLNDGVYGDRYWSRNFVVVPFVEADCTLLIINSCAFHGYASPTEEDKDKLKSSNEHTHGKISSLTLDAISNALKTISTRLNIILVHHHPIKLPFVDDGNSLMVGGAELVDALKRTEKQWLIIHGHQHIPHLTYADSHPFSPVIFSSGSVSARTAPIRGTHPRNQIHHVSIPLSELEAGGGDILGRVTSWSWINTSGWQRARSDAGIPYHSGFGYKFDAKQIRDDIVLMVKGDDLLSWKAVSTKFPKLDFLVPEDLKALLSMIEVKGVAIEKNEFGIPSFLELKK
jgi:3',5'-cyclic AMP phosphodiesterase CpdA